MNHEEYGLFLLMISCIILAVIIARLILGILARIRCGRDLAGKVSLYVLLTSISSLLSMFSRSNLLIRYCFTSQKALMGYITASGYIGIAAFALTVAANYLLADYCRKKYGAGIRIAVMSLILATPVVNTVLSHLTIGLVTADKNYELYNAITSLPRLLTIAAGVLLAVVFTRNRSREDVFRSIFILFLIAASVSGVHMLMNILIYHIPEIIYYLIDLVLAFCPLALAIYVFVCSGRVRSKGIAEE